MSRSRDVSDQRTSDQATPDKNQSKSKPGHKRRRTIGFMPLEPRVMYDGAAVATAATTHHHHHDGGPSADSGHAGEAASAGAPNAVTPSVLAPTPSGGDGHWHQAAPTEPMPTVTTFVKNPTEIVFIDQQAPDYQLLASGVKPGIEVVVLDPNSDGLQQIANFLQRHPDPNLTTIDIVAHGQDGMLFLGNAVLDNNTVGQYAAQLKTIGASLQPGGDLMLYGCDVAANPDGVNLLAQIIDETGVNVAASTGPVGSAAEGGSWALNAQSGVIDAKSPFTAATMAAYPDVLNADLFVTTVGSSNGVLVDLNGAVTTATFASGVEPADIVLDTADGLYFVVNNGSSATQILGGRISNALAGNGALFTLYSDTTANPFDAGTTADYIVGLQVDTVNHLIYFVDNKNGLLPSNETSVFERLSYSPTTGNANGPLVTLGTVYDQNAAINAGATGGVTSLAMDFTNPNSVEAVFAVNVGGSVSFTHTNPATAELFVAKNLTPTATTATITALPLNIPVADGFFTSFSSASSPGGLAIDDNNGNPVLYFTLEDGSTNSGKSNSSTGQGLYSYSLSSTNTAPGAGAFTAIYQQTTGNLVELNAITIDTVTGKYYGTDGASNGTIGEAGIYVGSLNAPGVAPTLDADFSGKIVTNGNVLPTDVVVDDVTLSTGSTTVTYTEGSSARVVNDSSHGNSISVTDDGNPITSATVSVTNFQSGDTLGVPAAGLTGTNITESYNSATGVLTLSGQDTAAHYQNVLNDVTFSTTAASVTARTINFSATDGFASASGSDTVDIIGQPVVGGTSGVTAKFYQSGTPQILDSGITVSDPNGVSIGSATVTIGSLFGGDTLSFNGTSNTEAFGDGATITATYSAGVLHLTTSAGTASASDYQTALDKVQYNFSGDPTSGGADRTRTITWSVSDADFVNSAGATTALSVFATPAVVIGANSPTPTTSGTPVAADPGLTITDHNASPFTLAGSSATVTISGGFQTGDDLTIGGLTSGTVPTTTVTFSYNTTTHTLTLSGADSLADYQKALDEVQFNATSPNSGTRTLTWQVNDEAGSNTNDSVAVTSTVNAAFLPAVTAGAAATFTGGGSPVTLDSGLQVADSTNPTLASATVTDVGFIAGDVLNFTNTNATTEGNISGSYASGVLTLTSAGNTATLAQWQTALDAVTYSFSPANGDPTKGGGNTSRTIDWQITDTTPQSSAVVTSTLTTVHTPPSIMGAGGTVTFDGGGAAVTLDGGLFPLDVDSGGTLTSATVSIGTGFISGDTLNFTNTDATTEGNISISSNANGQLVLKSVGSTATLAQWQTALESVTYSFSPSNGDPTAGNTDTARTIDWVVNDGVATSTAVTSSLTTVHVAPNVVAGASVTFTAGSPVLLDTGLVVTDGDSGGDLSGATVTIAGFTSGDTLDITTPGGLASSFSNGTLTLSGVASIATYTTALESITFSTTNNTNATHTIDWTVKDSASSSAQATSTVAVHAGPIVTAGAAATFTGGGGAVTLDSGLLVTDSSNPTLASATVTDAGFITGDVLNFTNTNTTTEGNIAGSYVNGVLTLTSAGNSATLAQWQAALDAVTYSFSPANGDPTNGGGATSRTIDWQITDTSPTSSAVATSTLTTVHVAPAVNAGNSTVFAVGGAAVAIDGGLIVTDPDSGDNLTGATVTISSGLLSGDALNFTAVGNITGSYSNGTLQLTGNGTVEQYQAVLESVTYASTAADPSNGGADTGRSISWSVTDGSTSHGTSAAASSTIVIDTPPGVTAGAIRTYVGGSAPVILDPTIAITDSFGSLSGAKVTIGGAMAGDTLMINGNTSGTSGTISYAFAGGTLTLTGTGTTAQYQALLDAVTYSDGNNDPTAGGTFTARNILWQVTDTASQTSNVATSTVNTQHVAPTVTIGAGGSQQFDGGSAASGALDNTLVITDNNSGGNLTGAIVQIVNPTPGEVLNFTSLDGVTSTYSSGVLTLHGTASIADYQTMLRSVTVSFSPQNLDPTAGGTVGKQLVYWVVNDGNTVNGTNETFPGTNAINNDQPSLGLNQIVVESGPFPSPNGTLDGIPMGAIRTFAGADAGVFTTDAVPADGQLLGISANAPLFSLLGTNFGGDGVSTFALPNLEGRVIVGSAGPDGTSFGSNQFTLTHQNLPPGLGGSGTAFDNDQPSLQVNYIINIDGVFAANSTNAMGEVVPFLGDVAPAGYVFANGQLLSISANPALFSILGTTYGGDGRFTFALPDLNGKTIIGAGSDAQQTVALGATTGQDSTTLTNQNAPSPLGPDQPVSNDQPSLALTYLVATQGVFPNGSFEPDLPVIGEVIAYAGGGSGLVDMLQEGWAVANGATLAIQTNLALFDVLGTTYGGNGTTTFNLPDLVGRTIAGVGTNQGTTTTLGEQFGTSSFTLTSGNSATQNIPVPDVATSVLTLVHEPPVVTAGASATFDGGGSPVQIDSTLSVSAPDSSDMLTGATVQITGGFHAGDMLNFTNQNGISEASYSNGQLILSGNATSEQYQAALESITYSFNPANGDPTIGNTDTVRTISYVVNDNVESSAAVTSTLDVVHTPPSVTAGNAATFEFGSTPATLDGALQVSDPDSGDMLTGATVKIDNGFLPGDSLNFTAQGSITIGSNSNGVLMLTGNATSEQYQAALDSITFSTTNQTATSHTIDWSVSDSLTTSAVATSTVAVEVGPLITAGATATFTGGGTTPVALDSNLAISDFDGETNLTGAKVTISSGLLAGDTLNFTNTADITELSYSNGVLLLTGNATVAEYQAALASITYSFSPTNADPTNGGGDATRTISWQATDAQHTSPTATSTLDTVHVAPTVLAGGTAIFTGGTAASGPLDPTLQLSDVDSSDQLTGATVTIGQGLISGDTLNFAAQNGISGTYNNGVLTLTGNATVEQYQTALQSITYSFTPGGDPTNGGGDTARTISWTVNDGNTGNGQATAGSSTLDTVHVAPVVQAGALVQFNGGSATPVVLDGNLTVTDADSNDTLTGASVTIAGGLASGDTLNFTALGNITGSYSNGILTLQGNATVEQYQTVLRSVSYSFLPTNGDPSANGFGFRLVSWTVNDGNSSNNTAGDTSLLEVNHVPPTVQAGGSAIFTGGSATPVTLDGTLTLADVDSSNQIVGASVTISSGLTSGDTLNFATQNGISEASYINGVLTLQGNATVAQYQAALESVTYSFTTGGDPTVGGTDTTRGITWIVNDGNTFSGIAADTSTLTTVHVAPFIQAGNAATFVGGSVTPVPLDSALIVTNVDNNDQLIGATVTIAQGLTLGDTLSFTTQGNITGNYSNGVLTLSGNATIEQYQTVLDSVTYSFSPTNGDPTAGGGDTVRLINWTVDDGNPSSNTATVTSTLTTVHVPPTLTTGGTVTFVQAGSPATADSTLALSDPDSGGLIQSATVQITSGLLSGDTLTAVTTGLPSITATYSNGELMLSGPDTLADYQAVLRSVAFSSSSSNPTSDGTDPIRTLTWTVNDGASTNTTMQTSTIDVHAQPTVVAGAAATFTGGGSAQPLDGTILLGDFSSKGLTGATVSITSGLIGADTLNFTNQNGITGAYSNGVLTLSGAATVAEYQTALDSITYSVPAGSDPTGGGTETARTISWQVTDGVATSAVATSTLTTVHVAPLLQAPGSATFNGGGSPVAVDSALSVTNIDNNDQLTGATVAIAQGLTSGDTLNFTAQNGITGSYSHGVLTLSGNATIEQYQAALDSVTYSFLPINGDPTNGGGDTARQINWTVNDGNTSSNTATVTSALDIVHTPPTLTTGGTVTFVQQGSPATADNTLTLSDPDSGGLITGATVEITSGLLSGDTLTAVTTGLPSITASYSNGVLTLSGADTIADYQAVLQSVAFSSSSSNPTNAGTDPSRTLTWTVNDGASTNPTTQTSTIDVHALPTVVAGAAATFTGGGSAVTLDGTIALGDFSSKGLTGATVSITSGLIGADTLNFTNQNGITGAYSNGVLTLSGAASLADYQAALDSITYSVSPTNSDPTAGGGDTARTISWQVTDGLATSAAATSTLTTEHVPASVKTGPTTVTFTQDGPAVPVDATLALDDVDSNGQLTGATVSINSGLLPGDTLAAITAGTTITASYSNGVLTLTGADTIADYKAVLQSVNFSSNSSDPTSEGTDTSRGITWTVNDGASTTTATGSVNVSAVPTVVAGADASFQAGPNKTVVLDAPIGVFDDTPLTGATVTIAGGFQSGDVLAANTNGTSITASYNNGVLTLSGNDTQQHYQAVMASVTLSSTQFQDGKATIDWQVTDTKGRTSEVATSKAEISAAIGSLPLNNQGNPLPPPSPVNNLVAEFSGLTTLVTNIGTGQTFDGYSPPGAVHVIHSDVTASIGPDGNVAFNLPLDSLEAALGGDVVSVTASLADGQPLPTWLHFDTQNGQFAGLLPDNTATGSLTDGGFGTKPNDKPLLPEKITIEVIARDSHGNISITDFTIDLVRSPPKHSWNVLPGHGGFEHWGMLRDTAVPLTGEPILWDGELATDIGRDGVIHVADPVPAGRAGFSEQLKVHGLHALNADRAALLKNLRHVNWR